MIRTTATLLILLLISTGAYSQQSVQQEQIMKISFDDSASRYVLENAANALTKERDSIWDTYEGYRITLVWHEGSSYPVTWKVWERGLNNFIKDPSLIRKTLELSDSLISKTHRENKSIAQLISSYLSTNEPIEASVYFVAFTAPYAFCVEQNKIGIDITGHEWNFDTDCVLNITIHEIYHVGFRINSPDYKYILADPTDAESFLKYNYAYLQNEGMATYVGYKALDLFPSDYKHDDYLLLEDDSKVRNAISQINMLTEDTKTTPIDSLLKKSWDIGIMERAYYVAGAYMAKVIEEKYGTEHLGKLVSKGSLQFAREYNAIASDEYKIAITEL
jgi:putative zinc-dependent peptidase DUF5700